MVPGCASIYRCVTPERIAYVRLLKAPPDAAPISDKRELDARYRYWRRHILLTIWLGYALFYFTRKSFNAAVRKFLPATS